MPQSPLKLYFWGALHRQRSHACPFDHNRATQLHVKFHTVHSSEFSSSPSSFPTGSKKTNTNFSDQRCYLAWHCEQLNYLD